MLRLIYCRSGQSYFQYDTCMILELLCNRQSSLFCISVHKIFLISKLSWSTRLIFSYLCAFFPVVFWSNLSYHVLNIFMLLNFSRCKFLIKKFVLINMVYRFVILFIHGRSIITVRECSNGSLLL